MARLLMISMLLLVSCKSDSLEAGNDDLSKVASTDGAVDAASTSFDCKSPPADLKSCTSNSDCGQVGKGCYCGSQPVTGVALRYLDADAACESAAAMTCPLGCASAPGQVADDGKIVPDGSSASVRCNASNVCETYVP
jgi:hypothetical protein